MMKSIIRGFEIMLPILIVIYLFDSLYKFMERGIQSVIKDTEFSTSSQVILAAVFALFILFGIAYLIGKASDSKFISNLSAEIDGVLINNSRLYRNVKLKIDNNAQILLDDKPPIFVRFSEYERPGFLIEEANKEGKCVVYLPSDFNSFSGTIYVVPEKNIRFSKSTKAEMIYSLDHLGHGLKLD